MCSFLFKGNREECQLVPFIKSLNSFYVGSMVLEYNCTLIERSNFLCKLYKMIFFYHTCTKDKSVDRTTDLTINLIFIEKDGKSNNRTRQGNNTTDYIYVVSCSSTTYCCKQGLVYDLVRLLCWYKKLYVYIIIDNLVLGMCNIT